MELESLDVSLRNYIYMNISWDLLMTTGGVDTVAFIIIIVFFVVRTDRRSSAGFVVRCSVQTSPYS